MTPDPPGPPPFRVGDLVVTHWRPRMQSKTLRVAAVQWNGHTESGWWVTTSNRLTLDAHWFRLVKRVDDPAEFRLE